MNMSLLKRAVAGALFLSAAWSAQASVVFTITATSDKAIVLSASGTLEGSGPGNENPHILMFDGLIDGISAFNNDTVFGAGSSLRVGTVELDFAYAAGYGYGLSPTGKSLVYAGNSAYTPYQTGDEVSGQLFLNLSTDGKFAAPGATGSVYWGLGDAKQAIGSYKLVDAAAAVPEPASLALLGGGLFAAAAARRSRRRA